MATARFDAKKIAAIAFDWSGTISDDIIAVHRAVSTAWETFGITIERDPILWGQNSANSATADLKIRIAEATAEGDTATAERLARVTGEAYARVYEIALRGVIEGRGPGTIGKAVPTPIEGAVPALRRLRAAVGPAFVIEVISAHPQQMLAADVARYGLGGSMFGAVVGDCRNKGTALADLARRHSLGPRDIIYVGDTVGDVAAAKAAGVVSVGVTGGYHLESAIVAAQPESMFESAEEFIDRFVSERARVSK